MSEHPGANASSRFRAFWAGVLAFLCFGIVALLVFRGEEVAVQVTSEAQTVIDDRLANLEEVKTAQEALLPTEKLAAAQTSTLGELKGKKAAKSSVVVPGSDTFMKQMQGGAPAEPAPEKKEKADEKPKPAEKKPVAPAKKPAMPAKPEAEAKKETPAKPAAPADPAAIEKAMALGKAKFMICGACHGPDGKGMQMGPGMSMAPAYAESEIVKEADAEMFALVVMKGIAKEDTKYMGVMAALEATLTDDDLAGIMTYVRNTFGGHKDLVTSEQAAAWRANYKDITAPVKRSELEKIVKENKPKAPAKPKTVEPAPTKSEAAPAKPAAPADPAAVEKAMALGKAKFMICGACHGPDGKGMQMGPGMSMAPAYAESEIVKMADAERFALVVMKGIAKEDTKYLGVMAALEATLTDDDLAGVLTYIRNTFGGHKDLVAPEQAAAWRAKYKGITNPVKRSELEKIVKEAK